MNPKIIMQRFAKTASSKTKASLAIIEMDSGTLHSIKLGLVTVVLFASACVIEIKALLALVSADLF
jgi:hypothetical protein